VVNNLGTKNLIRSLLPHGHPGKGWHCQDGKKSADAKKGKIKARNKIMVEVLGGRGRTRGKEEGSRGR